MSDRVIIVKYCGAVINALLRDDRVWDISAHRFSEEKTIRTGDIYKGKVIKVQNNLNAAFLLLSDGVKAFMDVNEHSDIRVDQEITVGVLKEAFGEKEMVVTPEYSVAGKYIVLTKGRHGVGVSRRITDERKAELKKLITKKTETVSDLGAVVRTNAGTAPDSYIEEEFEKLYLTMREIEKKASYSVPFIKLYSAPSMETGFLRDLRETPDEVLTDDPGIYEYLKEELRTEEALIEKIRLYNDDYPLIKLCRLEAAIDEAFKKVIYLKDGGSLVIEQTEAAHVIDVNSGKNTKNISKDELILNTNLEAVREAARQMRIRNLSGMILIDLINMRNRDHRDRVIGELKSELLKDRLRADFIDLTGLGIAEITREKERVPLKEVLQ